MFERGQAGSDLIRRSGIRTFKLASNAHLHSFSADNLYEFSSIFFHCKFHDVRLFACLLACSILVSQFVQWSVVVGCSLWSFSR